MNVVIELRPFLIEHAKKQKSKQQKITDVAEHFGFSRQTFSNWEKIAPDVVHTLFYILKDNPDADVFKALKNWQKPPAVLAFLRDFLAHYQCEFLDIVKGIEHE